MQTIYFINSRDYFSKLNIYLPTKFSSIGKKIIGRIFYYSRKYTYLEVSKMSKFVDNLSIATMYQVEIIIDILIKNNLVTKEDFKKMIKERIEGTLMDESEKLEILSLINY